MTVRNKFDKQNIIHPLSGGFFIIDGRSDRARAIDAEIRAWAKARKKRLPEQCDVLIIKRTYPNGKYLGLFARRRKNSWEVWVNCAWGCDDHG